MPTPYLTQNDQFGMETHMGRGAFSEGKPRFASAQIRRAVCQRQLSFFVARDMKRVVWLKDKIEIGLRKILFSRMYTVYACGIATKLQLVISCVFAYSWLAQYQWKSARKRRKHCALAVACSKAEPKKNFASPQTPFPGAQDGQNLISCMEMVTYRPMTQFSEDRCTQFRVIVVTDPPTHPPTNTHPPTDRIDYNTLCRS